MRSSAHVRLRDLSGRVAEVEALELRPWRSPMREELRIRALQPERSFDGPRRE